MKEYIPGLAGVPATKSAISSIDGEKGILAYRGYSIQDLVKHSSFEETALLLMQGELPTHTELCDFKDLLQRRYEVKRKIRHLLWSLPSEGHSMDVLQTAIASMATFYPGAGRLRTRFSLHSKCTHKDYLKYEYFSRNVDSY